VIGIVASRLVDRFHRPAVMVALNNGVGQGSARSVAGFHLAQALEACDAYLEGHGGHEMAAGLRVQTGKFEAFRQAFREYANRTITPAMLTAELKLEAVAELNQITPALVRDLKRLGPFGHANPKPLLCCQRLTLAGEPRRVGKTGDHLQLYVRQGDAHFKCIAFNHGSLFNQLTTGTVIDVAIEPAINEYQGRMSVELQVKDLHICQG
jgi:single-stranded-DNA-specific exonuclease